MSRRAAGRVCGGWSNTEEQLGIIKERIEVAAAKREE